MLDCIERLIADHRDTEKQLDLLSSELGGSPDWPGLQAHFERIEKDLRRHFAYEEQALFPALSQYRTMMLMEVEHDDLLALERAFAAELSQSALERQATLALVSSFEAWQSRLRAHIVEEDRGIFPLAEAWLEPEEKAMTDRWYHELEQRFSLEEPTLVRPQPGFEIKPGLLLKVPTHPLDYQMLYERDHTQVQSIHIRQGQAQSPHWAGQNQCLLLLSGKLNLKAAEQTALLQTGDLVQLDSRLLYSLSALEDSHYLMFRTWPHPHYTKN